MVGGRCVKPTWAKNNRATHCRRPISLRVSFSLNVGATVTITLERQLAGREVNGRCIKSTRNNTTHTSCTWLVTVSGKLVVVGKPGANQFTFNGKLGGQQLGPGNYQLSATPSGGRPASTMFTIVS
jgi:hypothetical protein